MKRIAKRFSLALALTVISLFLCSSSPVFIFDKTTEGTGFWEIEKSEYVIGELIRVKLYLFTDPGVTIETDRVPKVGDTWQLPPRAVYYGGGDTTNHSFSNHNDPSISVFQEGEVEIVSRTMRRYSQGDKIVTEFNFEMQYLAPVDFAHPKDDKMLPEYVNVYTDYLFRNPKSGEVFSSTSPIEIINAPFFMLVRVNGNSQPVFSLYNIDLPKTPWTYLIYVGYEIIAFVVLVLLRDSTRYLRSRRQKQTEIVSEETERLTLNDFYSRWRRDKNYQTFIDALIAVRQKMKLSEEMLTLTTYILYSGVVLKDTEIMKVFEKLLKEVSDANLS